MSKAPAFQFYAQDFLTGVTYLTNEEIGMYIKLLAKQWTDGKIPLKRIEFLIGKKWNEVSEELQSKFKSDGEFILNERLEEERNKQKTRSEKASENAERRWNKKEKKLKGNEVRKKGVPQAYVIRCFNNKEEFIKVGCTEEYISRRYSGKKMPYDYEVIQQFFGANFIEIESELNDFLKNYTYHPKQKFGGSNECYSLKSLEKLEKFKSKHQTEYTTQMQRRCNTDAFLEVEDRSMKYEDEVEKEEEEEEIEKKVSKVEKIDHEKIVEIFNSVCPRLPTVKKITKQRKSAINARINEYSLGHLGTAFQMVSESNFLNGENDRGWSADFDWIMNPNNFIKILEGKYNGKAKQNSQNQSGPSDDLRRKTAERLGLI